MLARGICFSAAAGKQQIPRYARDDNSWLLPRDSRDTLVAKLVHEGNVRHFDSGRRYGIRLAMDTPPDIDAAVHVSLLLGALWLLLLFYAVAQIISLILAAIVTIFVNYISRSSEKKVPVSASIIADMNQSDIEYARVSKLDEYKSTDNEIQRSAIFNRANSEMNDAIRRTNGFAKGWIGKIDSITTNHGGTTAECENSFNK